jgi:hypothetical protein
VNDRYYVLPAAPAAVAPSCPPVDGFLGTWSATNDAPSLKCFSKANTADTTFLCIYNWSSDVGADPDVSALVSQPNLFVAPADGGDGPTCASSPLPFVSIVHAANVVCPPQPGSGPPNGPKGCDVCGIGGGGVYGSHLFIPASSNLHTFAVPMDNGTQQVFTLGGTAATQHWGFVSVRLPPPPDNASYTGEAYGYGYITK